MENNLVEQAYPQTAASLRTAVSSHTEIINLAAALIVELSSLCFNFAIRANVHFQLDFLSNYASKCGLCTLFHSYT